MQSPLYHLLFFRPRLSKLRKLFTVTEEAGEEGGRSIWSSWRNHLPCWRRRKIHPAKGSGAAGTSSLPTAVAVAPAVAECSAPGLFANSSSLLRCSLTTSTDSSLDPAVDTSRESTVHPSLVSLNSLGVAAWFMGNRGKRDQVQLGIQHDFYFLRCMINSCMEAQLKKEAQLDVPFSKAEMVSALVEVVERHQSPCKPGSILPSALMALSHLSRLKPKTPRELETRFLGLALPVLASLQELSQDREEQTFYENTTQSMQVLLQSLLQEDPTIGHLFSLLDQLQFGLQSEKGTERAWATQNITALLRQAVLLRDLKLGEEVRQVGQFVANLGILLADAEMEVGWRAQESLHRLFQLLLRQRGINTREAPRLWCSEKQLEWGIASYKNIGRVGKVFRELFSAPQRASFLDTVLQAVHQRSPRLSIPGLLLLYSFVGIGEELLGMDAQATEANISQKLHKFRDCGKQPVEYRCLVAGKGDVIIEDLEDEDE
ncbi:maestro heat-like repeat-containing protein family member 7 [Pogona vitticeps]